MNPIIIYQKGKSFVFTRQQDKTVQDAEEFLHNLEESREQLKEIEDQMKEFKRDIAMMEKFEALAKKLRDEEIDNAKKEMKHVG